MNDDENLPEHILAAIELTNRHAIADRAIAYALGVLETAIQLVEDEKFKRILTTALQPLRQYEDGNTERKR